MQRENPFKNDIPCEIPPNTKATTFENYVISREKLTNQKPKKKRKSTARKKKRSVCKKKCHLDKKSKCSQSRHSYRVLERARSVRRKSGSTRSKAKSGRNQIAGRGRSKGRSHRVHCDGRNYAELMKKCRNKSRRKRYCNSESESENECDQELLINKVTYTC